MDTIEHIKQLLQPILDANDAELVDIILNRSKNKSHLRILVDKEKAITLEECSIINRQLGDILETSGAIQGSYLLEVSSPGLDRPLKHKRDFEKVAGKEIELFAKEPINGKPFFHANVNSVDTEGVYLKLKDNQILKIAFENISRANLVIRF